MAPGRRARARGRRPCECALDGAFSGAFMSWAQATFQTSLPLCHVQEGGF